MEKYWANKFRIRFSRVNYIDWKRTGCRFASHAARIWKSSCTNKVVKFREYSVWVIWPLDLIWFSNFEVIRTLYWWSMCDCVRNKNVDGNAGVIGVMLFSLPMMNWNSDPFLSGFQLLCIAQHVLRIFNDDYENRLFDIHSQGSGCMNAFRYPFAN